MNINHDKFEADIMLSTLVTHSSSEIEPGHSLQSLRPTGTTHYQDYKS